MITLTDFLKGRDKLYPKDYTVTVEKNSVRLIETINKFLTEVGIPKTVNSGWRPYTVQMEVNPRAPNSKHVTGNAIDLEDKDRKLTEYILANLWVLEKYGLYMEDPESTKTWVHLQNIPPRSGKRIFRP